MSNFNVLRALEMVESAELSTAGAVAILGNYMPLWQAEMLVAWPGAVLADAAAGRRLQAAERDWRDLAGYVIESAEIELELIELRDVA